MKKIKIFSTIALSLALASCDNFELPNPPAQSNPDPGVEGVFENSGLRLSQSSADVNLIEASNKNENVAVARIDELVNFPEGYDLRVDMQVAGNDQFGKYATVKTTIADNLVYVNPTDFDSAIQEAITRNPAKLNVATRFVAYAERGTTLFRLGGMDEYYGRYEYSVKPLDPAKTLEQDYYLVGSFCNWDPRKAIKFNNTVAGANIYDNPVLAVRVEITEQQAAAGYEFKVITCVVLGGVSVSGGSGRMSGVVAGTFIISALNNGMVLINLNTWIQNIVLGIVLVLAVGFDCYQKKKQAN